MLYQLPKMAIEGFFGGVWLVGLRFQGARGCAFSETGAGSSSEGPVRSPD